MSKQELEYSEDSIVAFDGLDGLRHRASMYIGELGDLAVGTLFREAIDNALDEALAGRNAFVQCSVTKDGFYIVHDGGQGIPVGEHPKLGISTLEVIFTKLHAGGKFNSKAYSASRGTHGVGNKAITALSTELHVYTYRDGKWWSQSYSKGVPTTKVVQVKDKSQLDAFAATLTWPESVAEGGTLLAWKIDESIIGKGSKLDRAWVEEYLTTIAMLNPGFYTAFKDEKGKGYDRVNEEGPTGFIKYYAKQLGCELEFEPLVIQRSKTFKKIEKRPDAKGVLTEIEVDATYKIDVAIQITNSDAAHVWGYTNCGYNSNGGTHVAAFWDAFYNALLKQAEAGENFAERDVQLGLMGYINWAMSEPAFNSQTKERLVSKVADEVRDMVSRDLTKFFTDHPEAARVIIDRAVAMASARTNSASIGALAAALGVKGKSSKEDMLPAKLQVASVQPLELFVVEGDSAGGHAKYGRIQEYQEVLPLRGKIANVAVKGFDAALASQAILDILKAMQYNPKLQAEGKGKLRHERLFLTADADPDGKHITLLLVSALWYLTPELITSGKVFIVDSPLYLAIHDGKEVSADTLDELLAQLPENFKRENIIRAKGLGELSPEWLHYTVFNPRTRKVRRVEPPATKEEEEWFASVVGENPAARRVLLGIGGDDAGGSSSSEE